MSTVLIAPEQRVVLEGVTWEMYEDLLGAHLNKSVPRFTYDNGRLEIMSPSSDHEYLKDTAAFLVNIIAEELNINAEGFGSTTIRREDAARGFEPDACFYFDNIRRVKGKRQLDFDIDPAPDLVIEIDITNPSLPRFPIFAQFNVPEVWRHDGKRLQIFRLENADYKEQQASVVLPGLTPELITELIDQSDKLQRLAWLRLVRERTREI